ncbi:unnamed protein product [Ectocarpus sp. CCAP 1310/34]|nr:unnamed protein product [Ectocarpus sp. CCAP 1310/34]
MGNLQSMMVPRAAAGVLIMIPAVSAASSSGWSGWEVGSTSTWEWGLSTLRWTLFQILVVRLLKKMSIDVAAIRASHEANQLNAQGPGRRESAAPPGGPQNARPIGAAGNGMQEAGVQAPAPAGPQNARWFTWLTDPVGAAFNGMGGGLPGMEETPTHGTDAAVNDMEEAAPHNMEAAPHNMEEAALDDREEPQ